VAERLHIVVGLALQSEAVLVSAQLLGLAEGGARSEHRLADRGEILMHVAELGPKAGRLVEGVLNFLG
jgi:hypothetical protein